MSSTMKNPYVLEEFSFSDDEGSLDTHTGHGGNSGNNGNYLAMALVVLGVILHNMEPSSLCASGLFLVFSLLVV